MRSNQRRRTHLVGFLAICHGVAINHMKLLPNSLLRRVCHPQTSANPCVKRWVPPYLEKWRCGRVTVADDPT